MIVLHSAPLAREFVLWGEAAPTVRRHVPGRRSRSPASPSLPFGAGKGALAAAIAEVLPGVRIDERTCETRIVWVPSVEGQPVASSPLIAAPPETGGAVALQPWSVVVVRVEAGTLFDLLAATLDKKGVAPGVTVGGDWTFWASALRFA